MGLSQRAVSLSHCVFVTAKQKLPSRCTVGSGVAGTDGGRVVGDVCGREGPGPPSAGPDPVPSGADGHKRGPQSGQ